MDPDGVLVRFGELGTKGRSVRRRMELRLRDNVDAVLRDRGVDCRVRRTPGRIVVRTATPEPAAAAAAELPGVVSTSPAAGVDPDADAVYDALAALAADREGTFDSYAVRASRAVESYPESPTIEREGGSAIGAVTDAAVDLEEPNVTFEIDAREEAAFVFAERYEGPGGLPVGTQAPLVALVSGGIDSPVAAFEAMRRGAPVIPVYVDLGDYGGADHRARAISACGRVAERAPNFDLRPYVVDGGDTVAAIADAVDRGRMLSLRRYFLAVAAEIARTEDAAGIVTGEVLGQKSSQTARNLRVTSAVTELPIHRPLFSTDKPAIVERAKELGTFGDAAIPAGCNRLAPENPETAGRLEGLLAVEPDDLLERAAADAAAARRVSL